MTIRVKSNLTDQLIEVGCIVNMAQSRLVNVRLELESVSEHVPAAADALHFLSQATDYLEPVFGALRKLIHDPACANITLSGGAEGQVPSMSGQQPSTDTQSANDRKPDSAVSLSDLLGIALPGLNSGNHSVAERVLAQFLNAANESQPQPESDSELEFECPMFAQVADLIEQVNTLQDDVKMLVEICRSQQNQLKLLKEAVFADANFFNRKVAIGN